MSTIKAADDYAAIAARMREIADGREEVAECHECDGRGWVTYANPVANQPNFVQCPRCENPKGLLCPS